jgi:DNA-binding MarR family transcriptional regulator
VVDPLPLSPAEADLWHAFGRVLGVLPRLLDGELQTSAGISGTEYVALTSLADVRPAGLRISELADRLGLSPSRTSRLADGLVRRGEIVREQDARDARGHVLTITETGFRRAKAAWPHHVACVRRYVLDRIDVADRAAVTRALRAIVSATRA